MYGLKYTVPFKTVSNIDCLIKLEVKDYTGASTELIGGGEPFKTETDGSDLLSPIRSSSATLSVFGADYLQDLYSSDPQGIKVTLLVNSVVKWVGFVTPDTFSQDFSSPEFIYEIECVAALSTLKYKEFDLTADFVTFEEIIAQAVVYSGYTVSYLTNSVRTLVGSILDLKIASSNFYDELGEAMTYYEVLEEMAKFLGCCFTPFEDDLYLLDYQAIKAGYNSYTKLIGLTASTVTLSDLKNVTNYKGTGAKLSRIAGKNKATVKCSLYEAKELIPDFDDKGSLYLSMSTQTRSIVEGKDAVIYKYIQRNYNHPKFTFYTYQGGVNSNPIASNTAPTSFDSGSGFVRTVEFKEAEPPSSISLTNELQVKAYVNHADAKAGKVLSLTSPIVKIQSDKPILIHENVWFCISLQVKRVVDEWGKGTSWALDADATWNQKAKLKIGNYYYNGTSWILTDSTFAIPITYKKGENYVGNYKSVDNNNTYTTGLGDLTGFTFKAPDFPLIGKCEFTLYCGEVIVSPTSVLSTQYLYYKDIKVEYAIPNEQSIYGDWVDKDSKNDVIYENVIAGTYVDEAESIDLKICTNVDEKLALSSVILGSNFLETLTTDVFGTDVAENILLNRITTLFDSPRFVIDPTLSNTAKPYTLFTESHLNKQFLVAGGEEDVKMESCTYNLIES